MKKTTPLELFFDLVFVYAVTRSSELLQADHSAWGLLRAAVAFIPLYWLWVGMTMHANLHEVDVPKMRLVVFGVAASGLVMGLALPTAWEDQGLLFAGAYWAGRLLLWLAVHRSPDRAAFITFPIGAFITGPALVVGALLPGTPQLATWTLAAVLDLLVPLILRNRVAGARFHTDHLADRYSTFILIALGETIVATAIAATDDDITAPKLLTMAVAFVICCALWWTYFDLAAPAIERGLEAALVHIDLIRPVLSYGHLGFVAGIVGVAAAIGTAVRDPLTALHPDMAALLFGGAALYLATFGFTRWRLSHTVAVPRLAGAVACLLLAWAGQAVPAVWALVLLAAVQIAVIAGDTWRARHRAARA